MQAKSHNRPSELLEAFPSFPCLALGFWFAWMFLTYSGEVWVSQGEPTWIVTVVYLSSSIANAAVFIIGACLRGHVSQMLKTRGFVISGGAIASIGSFVILAAGPHFRGDFMSTEALTGVVGAGMFLTGIGTGIIGLKCGMIFSEFHPRKALLYTCLCLVLSGFLYFTATGLPPYPIVEGAPALASSAFFVLLPLVSGVVAALSSSKPSTSDAPNKLLRAAVSFSSSLAPFFRLVAIVFVANFIISAIREGAVLNTSLDLMAESNAFLMFLKLITALCVALWSLGEKVEGFDVPRLYGTVLTILVVVTAATPLAGTNNLAWTSLLVVLQNVIDILVWCLMAFISYVRRVNPLLTFGVGYGFSLLAGVAGRSLRLFTPFLSDSGVDAVAPYLLLAALCLFCVLSLFMDKGYARMFSTAEDQDELSRLLAFPSTVDRSTSEVKPRFKTALESISAQNALSSRESEAMRYLAMGYTGEEAASAMGISLSTLRTYHRSLYHKLGVHSKMEVIRLIEEHAGSSK